MKRILVSVLTLAILLCEAVPAKAVSEAPLLRFTCVSDLHLDDRLIQGSHKNRDQFSALLSSAAEKGYSDLFVCGGDVSSYGNTTVWSEARSSISAAGFGNTLWALGNHAYGTVNENANADQDFKTFIGEDSIYYHKVINGIHFLCMAAEKCDLYVLAGQDVYGSEQIQWLERELSAASADSDGKPIFVISHYPLSSSGVANALTPILTRYQNVFFLWGHSHDDSWVDYSLSNYVSADPGFVTARAGCLQYGQANQADALLVDVFSDRVILSYDRTDGAPLTPNSLTVPLETSSLSVTCEKDRFYWCVPSGEDIRLLFCSYDSSGMAIATRIITPAPNTRQYIEAARSSGSTSVFFVDAQLRPVCGSASFPQYGIG